MFEFEKEIELTEEEYKRFIEALDEIDPAYKELYEEFERLEKEYKEDEVK